MESRLSKMLVIAYSYLAEVAGAWPDCCERGRGGSGRWSSRASAPAPCARCVACSTHGFVGIPRCASSAPRSRTSTPSNLVAPIWLGRLAGPMRSFVANFANMLHDIALVPVMGSDRTLTSAAKVARLAQRTPLLEDAFLAPEIDDGSRAARLQAFGDALRSFRRAMPPQAARRARRTRPDDARASFIRDCS